MDIDTKTPHHPNDHDVAARAHQIWVEQGKPDGQAEAHWQQAEQELRHSEDAAPKTKTRK